MAKRKSRWADNFIRAMRRRGRVTLVPNVMERFDPAHMGVTSPTRSTSMTNRSLIKSKLGRRSI